MPDVRIIPSRQKKTAKKRMAAYCRVSSSSEEQLHSYAAQVKYYTETLTADKSCELVGVYADEGISGTSARKRPKFMEMIADCHAGKIDAIITKSVSRFGRNTVDTLVYTRELKGLGIDVYFEKEAIHSSQPSPEQPFTGRFFCGVCGRTVVHSALISGGAFHTWWRCCTKVTRFKRPDDIEHDDCRVLVDRPAQVFVQAWNLIVSKRLQYEPRLKSIAETDNNELTRYHASVMLRLLDEVGKLDGFDYPLSLRTLDHMELQPDGKLTVVFLGGIRMTI